MLYNSGVILIFSVCVKRKNQQKQYAQDAAFHPDAPVTCPLRQSAIDAGYRHNRQLPVFRKLTIEAPLIVFLRMFGIFECILGGIVHHFIAFLSYYATEC